VKAVTFDNEGMIFWRKKICSQASLTVVVPAPEEPVMATTGCFFDIVVPVTDVVENLASNKL